MIHQDPENNKFDSEYFKYDPLGVRDSYVHQGTTQKNPPITIIPGTRDLNSSDKSENFMDMARCRGTIFIYQLRKDNSEGIVQY